MSAVSRRAFLAGLLASGAAACTRSGSDGASRQSTSTLSGVAVPSTTNLPGSLPAGLFSLGVASGDPVADSVILWTRLAPDPLAGGGMPDGRHAGRVGGGRGRRLPTVGAPAGATVAAAGLGPLGARRCRPGCDPAPVLLPVPRRRRGRARSAARRTAPAPGDEPDRLRFAFASCQNYQDGLLHRLSAHMAADDLDLVVFLGDYIYEGGAAQRCVPAARQPRGPPTLAGYRNRYAAYKSRSRPPGRPRRRPWVVHLGRPRGGQQLRRRRPRRGTPRRPAPEAFPALRAAAYQAYYEHCRCGSTPRRAGPAHLPVAGLRAGWPASTCSTPASTATTSPATSTATPACRAPRSTTPPARCSAPTRRRWLRRQPRIVRRGLERAGPAGRGDPDHGRAGRPAGGDNVDHVGRLPRRPPAAGRSADGSGRIRW